MRNPKLTIYMILGYSPKTWDLLVPSNKIKNNKISTISKSLVLNNMEL